MNITDRLFYDVWKEEVEKWELKLSGGKQQELKQIEASPFAGLTITPTASPDKKPWEK